jgi:hypothetical protein
MERPPLEGSIVLTAAIVLGILSVVLSYMVWMLAKRLYHAENYAASDDPELVGLFLERIAVRMRRERNWDQLEVMRYQIRTLLRDIDRLRHDSSAVELRSSKPQRNAERS